MRRRRRYAAPLHQPSKAIDRGAVMDGPRTVGRATSDMAEPGPTVIEAPLSPPGSVDPGFCGGGPVPISPRFTRRAKIIAVASLCAVIAALGLSSASIDQAR